MSKTNYWAKFEENTTYHIYNRGINGNNIFQKEKNYLYFLKKWKKLIHPFFDTIAYCLMPNHFHFLVAVKPISLELKEAIKKMNTSKSKKFLAEELSYNELLEDQFKRLFSSYALAFNKQENRTGSLFQKRFKRVFVPTEYKKWHLIAYIHHNPIHHQYAEHFEGWVFSSFLTFLSDQPTLLAREKVLSWLDEDREKASVSFLKFHQDFKMDREMDYLE